MPKRMKPRQVGQKIASSLQSGPGTYHWGVVQSVDGTTPATLTITLDGDDTPIPQVRFASSYVPTPTGFDYVRILKVGRSLEVMYALAP